MEGLETTKITSTLRELRDNPLGVRRGAAARDGTGAAEHRYGGRGGRWRGWGEWVVGGAPLDNGEGVFGGWGEVRESGGRDLSTSAR